MMISLINLIHRHHDAAQFSQNTAGNDLAKLYNSQPGSVPFDAFDADEQMRSLELLLSQERVVSLIYAKTFPIATKGQSAKGATRNNAQTGAGSNKPLNKLQQQGGGGGPNSPGPTGDGLALAGAGAAADGTNTNTGTADGDDFDFGSNGRPLTAGAILNMATNNSMNSNNGKSEKFPPIANYAPSNRLASR